MLASQALFWGALGAKQAYVVANEQRYATVGVNPETKRFALNVPDKEFGIVPGQTRRQDPELAGTVHRECTFVLTRKG